jgi:hypothetical protein
VLVHGCRPDAQLDVQDALASHVDLWHPVRRVSGPLDGGAVAAEQRRVAPREGRQMGASDLLLALHHEAEVHGQRAQDVPDRGLRHRLRHHVPLGVGHAPAMELAVLHDGIEGLVAPLVEGIHRLDVVVVVEDHRRGPGRSGDVAHHHRRPPGHVHQPGLDAVAPEDGPRGLGPFGFGLPPGADRRHPDVGAKLLHERVESPVDSRVHLLSCRLGDAISHVRASVRWGATPRHMSPMNCQTGTLRRSAASR